MRKTLTYLEKHKNIGDVRAELIRAHVMIVLLAMVSIGLLAIGNMGNLTYNPELSGIAVALLAVVAIVSLGVALAVARKNK
jgi:hypothetical protein